MILKRFQSDSLTEALRAVERECGADALIVETKHTERGVTVVAAERQEATEIPRPSQLNPAARWSRGFAGLAEAAEEFGLSVRVLRAVEKGLQGTRVMLDRVGDPGVPGVALRILGALIQTTDLSVSGQRILAVVGGTGVGKTTTLAKLAAARRDVGERVGIITIDTYRLAAVEQLRAYADLVGAPFAVAMTPADLRRAVEGMADVDRILIDTTGRSPFDKRALDRLRATIGGSGAAPLLCLAATSRRADVEAQFDAWEAADPMACVITKWDETRVPGEALSVAIERGLPLSHVTVGQSVPEDIVMADGPSIAAHAFDVEEILEEVSR